MNKYLVNSLGVFFLAIGSAVGGDNLVVPSINSTSDSQSSCETCKKNTGSCLTKLKAWMGNKEENQGRNYSGPRTQGVRPTPLYLYFQPACTEKTGTGNCKNNLNWSPTGWRDFTSTGHRMFDTPTQFGVGSGQK
ncbi:MAG: hypothetical protein EBT92_02645 [Planctomycetes bacterium]|nr:hypothetical protein [Planctomycetota bacterium]